MNLINLSGIFPTPNIAQTARFYQDRLKFKAISFLESEHPHIRLQRDSIEIILTQAGTQMIQPNHIRYSYGYDAYISVTDIDAIWQECQKENLRIIEPIHKGFIGQQEFVIEDIDGRWLAFGQNS